MNQTPSPSTPERYGHLKLSDLELYPYPNPIEEKPEPMNQTHFSIGLFPAGETIESQDEGVLYFLNTNDRTGIGPSESLFPDSEEGWKGLEDRILQALKEFREGVKQND